MKSVKCFLRWRKKVNLLSRSAESISIGVPWDKIYFVSDSLFGFPVTNAETS